MTYSPIFLKDGNLIVFLSLAFLSKDQAQAIAIGYASSTNLALYGIEFTGEALEFTGAQRYIPARLAGRPVAVLSGPAFTQRIAAKTA